MRTIVVVDDHAGFRTYATAFLAACGFRVVGEAADGRAALEASSQLRPDVILLDWTFRAHLRAESARGRV